MELRVLYHMVVGALQTVSFAEGVYLSLRGGFAPFFAVAFEAVSACNPNRTDGTSKSSLRIAGLGQRWHALVE